MLLRRLLVVLCIGGAFACTRGAIEDPFAETADGGRGTTTGSQTGTTTNGTLNGSATGATGATDADAGEQTTGSTPDGGAISPVCGDTTSDVNNCGACGHVCPGGNDPSVHCSASACAIDGCTTMDYEQKLRAVCTGAELSWQDARARCQALSMDLADVTDEAEHQATRAVADGAEVWIGLNQLSSAGDWYFVSPGAGESGRLVWETVTFGIGQAVADAYVPWATQPFSGVSSDCATSTEGTSFGGGLQFSYRSCSSTYGFVCEQW